LIPLPAIPHRFFTARSPPSGCHPEIPGTTRRRAMLDLLLLAIGLGFFALSVGYARGCERL
jgi:hypothetical protein